MQVGLNKNRDAPPELCNLATDLGKERNVADEHPEIVVLGKEYAQRRLGVQRGQRSSQTPSRFPVRQELRYRLVSVHGPGTHRSCFFSS